MIDKSGKVEFTPFELGDSIIIFLGVMGEKGLLVYQSEGRWDYHPSGSIAWDSFHQQVYRNFKADRMTALDLEERGIQLPAVDEYAEKAQSISWAVNFTSEMPFARVPNAVLRKLKRHAGEVIDTYIVLLEDLYETSFGDGRYLYPVSAFWSKSEALEAMKRLETEETDQAKREFYRYSLKEILLDIDKPGKKIHADLNVEPYEHYSIDDVVRLLLS